MRKKPKVVKARSLAEAFEHPDKEIVVEPQFKVKLVRAEPTRKKSLKPQQQTDMTEERTQLRADGRVEYVCSHGVGHTIDAPERYKKLTGKHWGTHGCDSCCMTEEFKDFFKSYKRQNKL